MLSTTPTTKRLNWSGEARSEKALLRQNAIAQKITGPLTSLVNRLSARTVEAEMSLLSMLALRPTFGQYAHHGALHATARMGAECPLETMSGMFGALMRFCVYDQLAEMDTPTLVIGGTKDPLTSPGMVRALAEVLPDSRHVELEGYGHMLMYEDPDLLHDLLFEFADELGAPRVN